MQRLSGNFLVNRVAMVHIGDGNIVELYELPNGQWQFGKGRDATVITSMEQVENFDPNTKEAVAKWLALVAEKNLKPVAMQAGVEANKSAESPHDRLTKRISEMNPETVARLLLAIENTLGPTDDSRKQGEQVNSHADGFGQDAENFAPGDTAQPFELPAGAIWADPRNRASGYFTLDDENKDGRGIAAKKWHPTPEFQAFLDKPETFSTIDAIDPVAAEMALERQKQPELAAAGSSRSARAAKARK